MYSLVEFPEIVEHYAPFFEGIFSAEAFIEFKRYISGLIVSENSENTASAVIFYVRNRSAGERSYNACRLNGSSPYNTMEIIFSKGLPLRTLGCGMTIYTLAARGQMFLSIATPFRKL